MANVFPSLPTPEDVGGRPEPPGALLSVDAEDVSDEFDALRRALGALLADLQPIDRTMGAFLAGGPQCAQKIERHYETLRAIEIRIEQLGDSTTQALEDAEDEIVDLLADEVSGGAP